jgi:hypothetical protein
MNSDRTYIKPFPPEVVDVNDDNFQPSDEQIMLDNGTDFEYTNPYSHSDDDLFDVGGVIETGGIFDDR